MSKELKELEVKASSCTLCGLADGRTNVVFGRGNENADLMLIGEGPGADEDEQGLPFVGRAGRLLTKVLAEEMGPNAESEIYIANMVKCRPPNNRAPLVEEVETCSQYLQKQIALIAPKIIMTLGNSATKPILKTDKGITQTRGQLFKRDSFSIIPTFHPAAIFRDMGKEKFLRQDLVFAFKTLETLETPKQDETLIATQLNLQDLT